MAAFLYIVLCLAVVGALTKPLGKYMARVYTGKRTALMRPMGWLERAIYRLCGIDETDEMTWHRYAKAVLALGFFGFFLLFVLLLAQDKLPFNPQGFAGLSADLAFNVAISFVTNTNWQSYGGEASLSYFSQMAGLTVQNFLSAATGMAVAVAVFRGLSRKQMQTVGNAYVDVVRGTLYILLPLSVIFAFFLVSQGVVQDFREYVAYSAVEKVEGAETQSLIPSGPVASQVAIKMLGSNGGGFFNANAAHPFENPTPLSNFFQMVSILLLPAALVYCFGVMAGDRRQGWVLLAAMVVIFLPLSLIDVAIEQSGNPQFDAAVIDQADGNMEGKEVRFGAGVSALWAVATTATSNGSVNSMHDSYMPLGGLIPLVMIQFGEVIFGGVGSGAYGMLMYVVLTVFIGGLMVGRTPEYLGKKLGAHEIKMASLVILIPAALILGGTAIGVLMEAGRAGAMNPGAHGFTEILYAFASASNNNGSGFAGLSANTPFYNVALGVCMFIGRYWSIIPVLSIAGSLAAKNIVPYSPGTLPTHTPLFVIMLVGSILLLDVLTYVPSLALGPVVEHIRLFQGVVP